MKMHLILTSYRCIHFVFSAGFPRVATFPKMISTQRGNRVTFKCNATGPPKPVIAWSKSQGSLPVLNSVISDGTLTIMNVTIDDSGSYLCNATNTFGTNSSLVELKVFCSLAYIEKPTSSAFVYVGQALKLSCAASSGPDEKLLWMYNGTRSLPQDTLFEAPDLLLIPSVRKDHAGNYSCLSRNSLHWNTSLYVKYHETCSKVRQYICDVSGDYDIDPDGDQGEAPFTVYCNMTGKGGIGVTAVSHDSEHRTHVVGFEAPGSYSRDIHYTGTTLSQIKGLMAVSTYCQQFIRYKCKASVLLYNYDERGWWVSRDGEKMTYWGGATEGCACRMTNSCANPLMLCNCDKNDHVWREDSGLLTNKSHLPVSQLRFGDTGGSGEEGYHTLGKLECYGMV